MERLEREQNNLRATIEWSLEPAQEGSRLETAFSVGWALAKFCMVRGFYREGQAVLEQLLAHGEGAAPVMRAKALIDVADFAEAQGDADRAEALYQESLVLYRELGDKRGIAYSLRGLGWVAQTKEHNSTAARSLMEECLAFCRQVGDKEDIAWSLANVADLVCLQGAYSRGLTLFEESLVLYRELGHKRGIALCLRQSAVWLFLGAMGDRAAVRERLEESLVIYRDAGDKFGEANYGWIAGWVVLREGDADTAHTLLEQSLALCRELGDRWHMILPLELLGRIEVHQGNFAAARIFHEEGLAMARALDDYWLCASCLEGLASVVATQGARAWAARLWGAAESLRERCGIPLTPVERADYTPAVAAVRTHLNEQVFQAAWIQGRTLAIEQVLATDTAS